MRKSTMESVADRLGLREPGDLLFHFPRRYEDRTHWLNPDEVKPDEPVLVHGRVESPKVARWRGGRGCFTLTLRALDGAYALPLVWYNMPFLKTYLTEGRELIAYGRLTVSGRQRKLAHPDFELVAHDEHDAIHMNRIVPIYPSTGGLNQRAIRLAMHELLFKQNLRFPEIHPVPAGLPDIDTAMRGIHFPESFAQQEACRRRLAFDELFAMQVLLALRRREAKQFAKVRGADSQSLREPFLRSLPFTPTRAQARVFAELDRDLAAPRPMNRLLQGDVGAGKTLVAAYAMLRTLERGENAALLAPTETLAEQHYRNLHRLLEPLGVSVRIFTRSRKSGDAALFERQRGIVYVGTHALFQDKAALANIGLGVIDEQHKFGVNQRRAFLAKGQHPDLLVMTATPIPRTLCLTLYGDLDVSVLDELPPGRKSIRTVLRAAAELPKVWNFIRREIAAGRQAYIVYPLLEESEKVDLKSVQAAFKELQKVFGEHEVVMLHGKMDPDEKSAAMSQFRHGQRHVMVATSVIEVGVDVPTATMMVIEHAERFGLAQLHQLRGRVGRGAAQSYCVLVGDPKTPEGWQRLKIMEKSQDGFVLAEEDLKIRGPGNILGTEQSGLPPLRVANLGRDMSLLSQAREASNQLIDHDPLLMKYPALRERLEKFRFSADPKGAN
ncbi:MAG: ATP-dependent DNA helicase RecG [Verrucomicrobiales bacterium]|nr:ATP-dependent DNA helicase RecG [Verrucomicrobiales bacterium]